jgi:hypothetical protein
LCPPSLPKYNVCAQISAKKSPVIRPQPIPVTDDCGGNVFVKAPSVAPAPRQSAAVGGHGRGVGEENNPEIKMDGDKALTANFTREPAAIVQKVL